MENSPIGALPGELRNLIYEFALFEPNGVATATEPGLLRTCKTIREEAELMFYALNHFHTTVHEDRISHNLCRWLKTRAGPRLRSIQSLNINCELPTIGRKDSVNGAQDQEDDHGILGFLQLMHLMASVREHCKDRELANLVYFTVNEAADDVPLEKIELMSPEDQDRYRSAKFLIVCLIHGEKVTMDALDVMDVTDSREPLMKLDQSIQARRGAARRPIVS